MQDLGQRSAQRRVKPPVKGLQPHMQTSEQRPGQPGRHDNLIGSSYAFTGANDASLASVNPATANPSSINKYEMYNNSGR